MSTRKYFIAYPATPADLGFTIEAGAERARTIGLSDLHTWREGDVCGDFVATMVRQQIAECDVLIADITVHNFNVYYEIGFAIGKERGLLLTKNRSIEPELDLKSIGVLDSLGYFEYENQHEFSELVLQTPPGTPIRSGRHEVNRSSPAYLLESLHKTDQMLRIKSRIKKARIRFRSFDPVEQSRLSAFEAIEQATQSSGLVLPLLSSGENGHEIHNLRAAFLAGLGDGLGRVVLLLQRGSEPIPIDFRDLVSSYNSNGQIDEHIAEFAAEVAETLQRSVEEPSQKSGNILQSLRLGASAAENEFSELGAYFLSTDAFHRARRGEVRLVVGRKGSGKTALFARLRDDIRRDKSQLVVDLKPEGYKLRKFREELGEHLSQGAFEHTITAVWEYLLLLEVARKLLERDHKAHLYDPELGVVYRDLRSLYEQGQEQQAGDFAERLANLLERVGEEQAKLMMGQPTRKVSEAELTRLLYQHDVAALRKAVTRYLARKKSCWILFDNLDKGWPTHGLDFVDLTVLRTLIEATRKLENNLRAGGIECHAIVFLRTDVYDVLIDNTPDRGKEAKLSIDWTDADLLRELLRRRLEYNDLQDDGDFESLWRKVFTSHVRGEESSQYLIDRCLMRPRSLIDLVLRCRGVAVNLGHDRIESDDIIKGCREFSSDLMFDIGFEIRDVFPQGEDALYLLIGLGRTFSIDELSLALIESIPEDNLGIAIELLVWFGVLGYHRANFDPKFIWDLNYDRRRARAEMKNVPSGQLKFTLNAAFWDALEPAS